MITAVVLALALGADIFADTFAQGNAAYQAGDYATAAQTYERLVASAVTDPVVFYNLGNAYYRQGRLGLAIANYERALELEPGFSQAAENLDKALRGTKRNLARPLPPDWEQAALFWHYGISRRGTYFTALSCWVLFWLTLGLCIWRPHRYARWAVAAVAVLAAAFGFSAWVKAHQAPRAVTIAAKAEARFGTSEQETVRFELFEGDRVIVDRREGGWARVTTVGGERGWTLDSNLCFVGPPYPAPSEP
jgi:tetratricopeptide (TPR) repeat protein